MFKYAIDTVTALKKKLQQMIDKDVFIPVKKSTLTNEQIKQSIPFVS
jgi:spermidine/putrescine-binding protein